MRESVNSKRSNEDTQYESFMGSGHKEVEDTDDDDSRKEKQIRSDSGDNYDDISNPEEGLGGRGGGGGDDEIMKSWIKADYNTNTLHTFWNLCKCFAGAASFELPWAIKEAGWLLGGVSILIMAILSHFTLKWLATCGHYHPTVREPIYPEIAQVAFGKFGYIMGWFGVLSMTIGVCGSYLVFIGTAVSSLLQVSSLTPEICTALTCFPLIGLSWLRSYKFLAPTSQLGLFALIFALVVTVAHGVEVVPNYSNLDVEVARIKTYPLFLGNAAFLYLIHSVVLPVEQHLKNRPRRRISKGYVQALNWAVMIVTIINVSFAVFLYLAFGTGTCGNVIDNLKSGVVKTLVKIFLSMDLFFTYALFLFPVTESLERTLWGPSSFGERSIEIKRNILRGVLVLATCGIALLVPSFQVLTGLTGAFGNNVLGLILPPLMYIKLAPQYTTVTTWEKCLAFSISTFGIVMFFVCTESFVAEIISGSSSSC